MAGNAKAIREAARRAGNALRAQPDVPGHELYRKGLAQEASFSDFGRHGPPRNAADAAARSARVERDAGIPRKKFESWRAGEGAEAAPAPKPTARPRAPRSGAEQVARDGEAFQLRAERSMERRAGVRGNPKPRIPKPGGAAEAGERSVVKATGRAVQSVGDAAVDAGVVSRGFRRKAAANLARRLGRGALEVGEKFAGPVGAVLAAKDVYDAGKWAQRQGDSSPRTMPTKARSGGMTVHPTPGRGPKMAAAHEKGGYVRAYKKAEKDQEDFDDYARARQFPIK